MSKFEKLSLLLPRGICLLLSSPCYAAASIPAGWIEVSAPEYESDNHRCANYASAWTVSLTPHDELKVASENEPRQLPSAAADLPASFKLQEGMQGRRSVFKIKNGWLLGFDAGEWGGGLWFVGLDGRSRKLASENVQGLLPTLEGVLVFSGLAHLEIDAGRISIVSDVIDDQTKLERTIQLDGAPRAFAWASSGKFLFVATTKGVSQIDVKGASQYLLQSYIGDLYPTSLVVAHDDTIYVGMRMFVVRLNKTAAGYEAHWLVPANCQHFEIQDFKCLCGK